MDEAQGNAGRRWLAEKEEGCRRCRREGAWQVPVGIGDLLKIPARARGVRGGFEVPPRGPGGIEGPWGLLKGLGGFQFPHGGSWRVRGGSMAPLGVPGRFEGPPEVPQ
eukprot:6784067-Pyramimonas_sp.AAC.1